MPYLESRRAGESRIYYTEEGEGQTVILIGGLSSTVETWGRLAELLAEHYRVIRPDNRGSGRTTVSPDSGDRSIETFAADVLRLLDGLGLEKVHLVGASMGGMIVQQFAVTHPERLASLTVACSHCGGEAAVSAPDEVVQKLLGAAEGTAEALRRSLEAVAHPDSFAERPEVLEYYQWTKQEWPHPPPEIQRRMEAISAFDVADAIRRIEVPTLVITGAKDVLVPVENSRRIAERIPGARLALVEGGGHIFFLEQPEAVVRELHAHFMAASDAVWARRRGRSS